MGSVFCANCTCGYESEDLFLGGGMMNFHEVCNAPALCESCEEIILLNYLAPAPYRCSKCKREALFYDTPSLKGELLAKLPVFAWQVLGDKTFTLSDAYYACPKCKQKNLRFYDVGSWD